MFLDGQEVTRASASGAFVIGFDRDALPDAMVRVVAPGGESVQVLQIAPAHYDIQHIRGLGGRGRGTASPELEARIAWETRRKREALDSRADREDFTTGFMVPLTYRRVSGRFGGQRIYGGVPRRPHYGLDLAAPRGTPVHAPAGGVVTLAENGLLYEGGLILIDHGQGLVSAYLHLSRIDVLRGQVLRQGELLGAVGATGRATGPHLCWRMTWRDRHMDPMLMVGAQAPA
ncbi:M23 family metallopeptidase [Phenylobacterium sp.]|uniref:M23 family metallopeptidase n=1 Tax=Phenylobacterium sp. TaxID=1871053 RepID=UPI00286BE83E|nr:M23 family metallopeptidase [Phenylobacterium sp.]